MGIMYPVMGAVLVTFVFLVPILNKIFYKKVVGIAALRRNNQIETIITPIPLIRLFIKYRKKELNIDRKEKIRKELKETLIENLEELFDYLKNGTYTTETHGMIKEEIIKNVGEENILIKRKWEKMMFFEKLSIWNTRKLFKKYDYYEIEFTINNKSN